eukprot:scaffold28997_cov21-Tisochrysis_lutea.AAC.1
MNQADAPRLASFDVECQKTSRLPLCACLVVVTGGKYVSCALSCPFLYPNPSSSPPQAYIPGTAFNRELRAYHPCRPPNPQQLLQQFHHHLS